MYAFHPLRTFKGAAMVLRMNYLLICLCALMLASCGGDEIEFEQDASAFYRTRCPALKLNLVESQFRELAKKERLSFYSRQDDMGGYIFIITLNNRNFDVVVQAHKSEAAVHLRKRKGAETPTALGKAVAEQSRQIILECQSLEHASS